ncbi:DUF5359 family protein [Niallia taxi]|uniref:DUF5359 family protein n=1 Tax=Niallia taxi TaxID=2499688 RepID=UPI0011A7EFDF|nr:DUF5359 family protein [Niallia taxi]MCT2345306.1 YpfB family protein [Niallia taxi]MDE5052019.1 DUF5359 family protein [Niallia taxi]MED3961871.1 DUF5359 family protein [Niallia taxi]WOD64473.1 YpfB family protein [Niallia taxi]
MKRFERLLIKLIAIQLFFLLAGQVLISANILPGLQTLAQYEGVTESNYTSILETIGLNQK